MGASGLSGPARSPDRTPVPSGESFRDELVAVLPHLRAYARFLARDRDLADDIVQDTLVRMLRSEDQYRPNGHFRAWAFTILRNRFYSHFRDKDHKTAAFDDSIAEGGCAQDGSLAFRDFHRAFWELAESHREVLMLIGRGGLSYEDAAKVCRCQVGTIRSRLSRARRELRRKLNG